MQRYLLSSVMADLAEKLVFLSGPRQVGKTTLARQVLEAMAPRDPVYLNWDRPEHRSAIRNLQWSRSAPVAVLDEVHKYARWKTVVKGFFDTEGREQRLLVTGSARLDVNRRGGDSLAGRYVPYRLHPLTVGEVAREGNPPEASTVLDPARWRDGTLPPRGALEDLLRLSGFPEPFLRGSDRHARRWRLARREQVLRQDMRDLTMLRELSLVEQLADLLAERVGSPLSINSLRGDLQVDHKTVSAWIEALDRLYVVFRVRPFAGSLARTLRKESKLYFWDWSEVGEPGPRFENLVASHLAKLCGWLADVEGYRTELRYVRDRDGREVDFLLLKERRPWVLVESKLTDSRPAPSLRYFAERLAVEHAFQIVLHGEPGRTVLPADRFFCGLP